MYICLEVHLFNRVMHKTYYGDELESAIKSFYGKETILRVPTIPLENEWFDVDPEVLINQEIFQKKRSNWSEERTRLIILEAFEEAKRNPEKYLKKFEKMYPSRKLDYEFLTEEKCEEIACKLGDHQADWIEQSFEWAQRIFNDEAIGWKTTCNRLDKSKWIRVIKGKDGNLKRVGGIDFSEESIFPRMYGLPTDVKEYDGSRKKYDPCYAVPLVIGYNFSIESSKETKSENKIILKVGNNELIFCKEEIQAILENIEARKDSLPLENEWYYVDPLKIPRKKFEYYKSYGRPSTADEDLREWILAALDEMEKNPKRYAKKFKIMFPTKSWDEDTTPEKCKQIAYEIGHHQSDWVEEGLLLAQRVMNGYNRDWLYMCADTSNWYRMICNSDTAKPNGVSFSIIEMIGGSSLDKIKSTLSPATRGKQNTEYATPSIVDYDD